MYIDVELKLKMLERMHVIRQFEEQFYFKFMEGGVPGTLHQCQGQEATAVGVCSVLRDSDYITTTHRPVGHCLAKGMTPYSIAAEIYGSSDGCSKGKGGAMHLGDFSKGVSTSIAIVGGGIPIAVGFGLSYKMKGEDGVAVSFFGDGASNEGTFHESINMAALWKLPVLFVCENNNYGASTSYKKASAGETIAGRAAGYGIRGIRIDGNNVLEVYETAAEAVERARAGGGPMLIEAMTWRRRGHSRSDPCGYRSKEEQKYWFSHDPLDILKENLMKEGINREKLDDIEKAVKKEIKAAIRAGEEAKKADVSTAIEDVYWSAN